MIDIENLLIYRFAPTLLITEIADIILMSELQEILCLEQGTFLEATKSETTAS